MNFDLPYVSGRSPLCAENIVATSQPLAAQAGIDALRRGGNAVDAVLATAITSAVVEPSSGGVGGDAFAQVWDGRQLIGLNASGRAPLGWTAERFKDQETMPTFGWDTITVPGAVSAWVALSERFGALPFQDLFEAPIRYAKDGFLVSPKVASAWLLATRTYADFPDFADHFLPAPAPGTRFRQPDLAHTLELIASTEGVAFYSGPIAETITDASTIGGGVMTLEDLATHQADWVVPIGQPYRDVVLHEIPPNGQGIAAQIALGIMQHLAMPPVDSVDAVHIQIEAMKIAIRTSFEQVADIDAMRVSPDQLLDAATLETLAGRIGVKATPLPAVPVIPNHDTVCMCAADSTGMMVSYLQSNYMGFGSGIVIRGTGIAMQNRGRGFSLDQNHPNCVGPGKRPYHTIIPGFVTAENNAMMAFGVMGGHMQHQGHVQMVQRVFDYAQNPQAACDGPRWIVNPDFTVCVESTFPPASIEGLRARGHVVSIEPRTSVFGGAQLIYRQEWGYIAGSDHRKDGQAIGF